ncbi:MAG TPA: molybdopterin-dependent oxidoreductase [Rhizomicrobium sp.]|jgi:DMSO/TMAO reductase YedYZ molybdopterin-dependent catalytic subunit
MDRDRRRFLTGAALSAGAFTLAGCDGLSRTSWWPRVLAGAEAVTKRAQRLVAGSWSLAPEYTKADIAPEFRANGTLDPGTPAYAQMAANGFRNWRIPVGGLVETPLDLSLADLRAMPPRTQITRHDCVEGWSCIGEWTGTPLRLLLAEARPKPNANYVVFYCADPMSTDQDGNSTFYYESLDLVEASHPQTLLAYKLNGEDLPVAHGAPVRLRCERQLGYKHAKYVQRLELVENFDHINGGKGGYWEDLGYSWWGGI